MSEHASLDWPGDFDRLVPEIRRAIDLDCRNRGAAQEAEEVGQIIVARLWEGKDKHSFPDRRRLFGYIKVAVRREIPHERLRATAGGRMKPLDPATLAEIAPAAADPTVDTPAVEEAIALIPDEMEREACRLSYEGLTLEEIGKRLGVSTTKAFWILDSAEKFLRKKLEVARPAPRRRK